MTLSRRDMLKMGLLGGAAVALPLERTVRADSGPVNRIAASKLPAPFTIPFTAPSALVPYRTDATTDYYKVWMKPVQGDVLPGFKTPLWGYNGLVPGPTVHVQQGRKTVVRHVNTLPSQSPGRCGYTPWTSVHLHGSASLPQFDGYASDITYPGQYKDYHYPNFQDGTHPLVPRPRRAPHRRERLDGPGRAVPPARPPGARRCPSRRATTTCR